MAIRVELELDSGDFERGVIRANTTLASLEAQAGGTITSINRMTESSKSFMSSLRDVTVTLGTAGAAIENIKKITVDWVGGIVKMNAEVERLSTLLRNLSTAADPVKDATKQLVDLREEAKRAPFSLEAMHSAFIRLKTGGMDPAKGGMKALTDAVAAFGGTDAQLARASLALQEMGAKGVVQMKELRIQLGQAIPGAMQIMARAVGVGYEKMNSDIHTGTVDAAKMIAAFNAEVERSFGDAAVIQMNTYNGQLARMKVIMLDLALIAGGENKDGGIAKGGFFDNIKTGFKDFNDLLNGDVGKVFARKLGDNLNEAYKMVRRGIETMVEFRGTIVSVGEAVLVGLGMKLAIDSVSGLVRVTKNASVAFNDLRLQWGLMRRELAATAEMNAAMQAMSLGIRQTATASAQQAAQARATAIPQGSWYSSISSAALNAAIPQPTLMARGAATVASGFTALANGARLAGAALPFVAAGFTAIAPWLPLIIGGVELLASAFGIFKNQAKEAFDEVREYGATSLKQYYEAHEQVVRLQNRANTLRNSLAQPDTSGDSNVETFQAGPSAEDVARAQKEANEAAEIDAKAHMQAIAAEGRKGSQEIIDNLIYEESEKRRYYRITAEEQMNAHKAASDATIKAGHDTLLVDLAYQDQRKKAAITLDEELIALEQKVLDAQVANLRSADEKTRAIAQASIEKLEDRIKDLKEKLAEAKNQEMGDPLNKKPVKTEDLYKKGTDALAKLKASGEGFAASITDGANPAVVALEERLRSLNSYGDWQIVTKVNDLIERMGRAKELADDLKRIVNDGTKLDHDIENNLVSSREGVLKELTDDESLTPTQKLVIKIKSGAYAGAGDAETEEQKKFIKLKQDLEQFGYDAVYASRVLQEQTFGPEVLNKTQGYLDVVTKMGQAMGLIKQTAESTDLGKMVPSSPYGTLTGAAPAKNPYGDLSGSTYLDRTVGKESGGDNFAKNPNSSATGAGQFISGTWRDFLRDLHPELLGTARELSSRHDGDLSREAVDWYGKKNALALERVGLPANDATVSLAHLLGPGGAIAALQAPSNTALSSIPQLVQALQSNPQLKGLTSTDLINQHVSKFGKGSTYLLPFGADQPFSKGFTKDQLDPRNLQNITSEQKAALAQGEVNDEFGKLLKRGNFLRKEISKAKMDAETSEEEADGVGKHYAAGRARIKAGHLGQNGVYNTVKDPDDPLYEEYLESLKKQDAADLQKTARRKQITRGIDAYRDLSKEAEDNKTRLGQVFDNIEDPNGIDFSKSYMQKERETRKRLAEIKKSRALGGSPEIGDDFDAKGQAAITEARNLDVANLAETLQKKTIAIRESLMTQDEAEKAQYERNMERLKQGLASFTDTEQHKAEIAKIYKDYADAEAAKRFSQSPIGAQMKGFTDITKNVGQNMTTMMSGTIDNLTSMISGTKVRWTSLIQSMGKDLVKSVLQFGLGTIFNKGAGAAGLTGGAGAAGGVGLGGLTSLGGGLFGGISSLFTMLHTGGIVGESSGSGFKTASIEHFIGAPRFHTGGIIGADEVPIIAQKGEGVFTKAQMAQMNQPAGNVVNFGDIHVNATGGTQAQNADLGKQISRNLGDMVDKRIAENMRQQQRTGNMFQGAKF